MPSLRSKEVFTTGDVARLCRVAPRTAVKWFEEGRLSGYKIPGSKDRRIPRENLIQFLKENNLPLGGLEERPPTAFVVGDFRDILEALQQRLANEVVTVEACDSVFSFVRKLSKPDHDGDIVVGPLDSGLMGFMKDLDLLGLRVIGIRKPEEAVDPNVRKVCKDVLTTNDEPALIADCVARHLLPRAES